MTTTTSRLVIIAGATASVLVYWTATDEFGGVDLAIRQGSTTQAVGAVAVAATALIAGLAGWGLLALLERKSQRPARIWTIIALTFLALSLVGPLGSGADLTSKLTLTGMHLLVGLIVIPSLARSSRYREGRCVQAASLKRG